MKTLNEALAEILITTRKSQGLSQADVAKIASLSRPSITNLENLRTSTTFETVVAIAASLNIDLNTFKQYVTVVDVQTVQEEKLKEEIARLEKQLSDLQLKKASK